ncbi:MAG TPA: murein biosynthesis integral membrane protein MurJ [Acidimicrobiales bacterium]|nr:murein biosynthesis integral membrane protein MurJ [Acidimicrobiales bacterium]
MSRTRAPGPEAGEESAAGPAGGRAALVMGVGTLASRVTGFLRLVALAYALGFTRLTDSYNLANTTPNIIFDLVLGGVLSATLIPVFVDRLSTRAEDDAWESISAVCSLVGVLLIAVTVVFEVVAPLLIHLYTLGNRTGSAAAEQRVATDMLRVFAPQLALYGFITLATALLNTRRRFAAPMFAPVANNLLVIAILFALPSVAHGVTVDNVTSYPSYFWLLTAGTTAGVAVQLVALGPSLWRADLRLRWRWDPRDETVGRILRLSGWTFGFVAANQVALWVIYVLANGHGGDVSAYVAAWTFFQLPYGIVAVSIMTALQPDMAAMWARHDVDGFRRRTAAGLRSVLAIMVPAAVGYVLLGHPVVELLLRHGALSPGEAHVTGSVLGLLAVGLPGFSAYLVLMRAYQAMQDTRTAFYMYLVENGVNIVAAFALYPVMGVRGLALSVSIAYTVGTVVALVDLGRRLGGMETAALLTSLRRLALPTLAMAVVVVLVEAAAPRDSGIWLIEKVFGGLIAGVAVYFGAAGLMGSRRGR